MTRAKKAKWRLAKCLERSRKHQMFHTNTCSTSSCVVCYCSANSFIHQKSKNTSKKHWYRLKGRYLDISIYTKVSLLLSSLWFHPHLCAIQHFFAATLHQLSVCLDDLSDTIPLSQILAIHHNSTIWWSLRTICHLNYLKFPPWQLSEFLRRCAAAKVSRSRPGRIDVYLETLGRPVVGWYVIRICWFAHAKWCKLAWLLGTYSIIYCIFCIFSICLLETAWLELLPLISWNSKSSQFPPSHASR